MGNVFEMDDNLREFSGQPLARHQIERDTLPAPIVQIDPHQRKGWGRRIWLDTRFISVSRNLCVPDGSGAILPEHEILPDSINRQRSERLKNLHLLIPDPVRFEE